MFRGVPRPPSSPTWTGSTSTTGSPPAPLARSDRCRYQLHYLAQQADVPPAQGLPVLAGLARPPRAPAPAPGPASRGAAVPAELGGLSAPSLDAARVFGRDCRSPISPPHPG